LPDPRELGGFRWKPYERARKKLDDIEGRRRDAQRRAAELKSRIENEKQADVKRLAQAILSGSDDVPPPELEDLAAKMRELHRLSEALKQAKPEAEAELVRVVQENRETWMAEVDTAVAEALEEERAAFQKAMQLADAARSRRQALETLANWVRTTPPGFSPPGDVSVRSAFDRLRADTDQAERLLHERAENERIAAQEAARLRREAGEGAA
jgi:hypothetical protein